MERDFSVYNNAMENNKRNLNVVFATAVVLVAVSVCVYLFISKNNNEKNFMEEDKTLQQSSGQEENVLIVMETNFGDIKLELFFADAPNTVENFLKLAGSGFYDGVKFHRVIKDFMIQSGDPNSKDDDWSNDGMGGPGYTFADEINAHKLEKGVLAMANAGPDTNGSQFFIVTADTTPWLDGKHTAFGKVVEGMDIVSNIEDVEVDKTQGDHPVEDVIIKSIKVVE